jgi:hypothetical protein
MKDFITAIFALILSVTLVVTFIVGLAWLFDFKPKNLYLVWEICYSSLAVSFLLFLLFGRIKN